MTNLLLKLFIKDHKNTKDPGVHASIGKFAGITGVFCNIILAIAKLFTGIIVGSMAIIADGINNLTDIASSVMTFLGFHLAKRPADKNHPYGHARFEYLSGLAIAGFILVIGFELVRTSVNNIIHPKDINISLAIIFILILSVGVKCWMYFFFKKLGKIINSQTLYATALDSLNDTITTTAVIIGCFINYFFDLNIDGYLGLAIALFIFYSGIKTAKNTISPLLGQRAEKDLVEKISNLILSHKKVIGFHDLLIHDYGPGQCYASVHVELSAEEDVIKCHDIIDDIENDILQQINVNLIIHYDPVIINDEEQNKMYDLVKEIVMDIDPRFSIHDFRLVKSNKQTKLRFDLSVPYSEIKNTYLIKEEIDNRLSHKENNLITIIHFDGKD